MKARKLFVLFAAFLTVTCTAQKVKKSDLNVTTSASKGTLTETATKATPKPVAAENTEDCQINVSLFHESVKQKSFADAVEPWTYCFENCKGTSRTIYTDGVKIVEWQIEQEKDAAKKEALVDKLLSVYDEQIAFFGDYEKQPRSYLLGMKGLALLKYRPTAYAQAYSWLEECVESLKNAAQPAFFQQFVASSYQIYKEDNSKAGQFIDDYLFSNDILEANGVNAELKNKASYAQVDAAMDQLFANSGAATVEQLDEIYGPQVEARKTDYDFLIATTQVYRRTGNKDSKVFFAASEYAHKIKPSAESANGCAEMAYKNNDFNKAIDFYEEAISLTTNDAEAAEYLLKIAQIYNSNLNNSRLSREYARKSIEKDPTQGEPYLLIGVLYANTRGIYDEPVLNKTVYWVAVDKFVKAKQVEPELTDKANELIRTYSAYFPGTSEAFMAGGLSKGQSFTVGGWIGETTTCRFKD